MIRRATHFKYASYPRPYFKYANYPRPFCISILFLGAALHKQRPEISARVRQTEARLGYALEPRPRLNSLFRHCFFEALVLGAVVLVAAWWVGAPDFAIRAVSASAFFLVSGCLLGTCWDYGRGAVIWLRRLHFPDLDAASKFEQWLKSFAGWRDLLFTIFLASLLSVLFAVSKTSLRRTEDWISFFRSPITWLTLVSSWVAFLPTASGIYWIHALYRTARRFAGEDKMLSVPPHEPLSALGLDRLWGLMQRAYWSYLAIAFVSLAIWFLPDVLEGYVDVLPEGVGEAFLWQKGGDQYQLIVPWAIAALTVGIGGTYLFSYLGISRLAKRQRAFYAEELWSQLESATNKDDFGRKMALLKRIEKAKSSPGALYALVNAAIALIMSALALLASVFDLLGKFRGW